MFFKVNLREVVYSLSTALDYVGIDDVFHGKRVGYLSHLIAKELGYPEEEINDIIVEGLLHDCGVSSTVTHAKLVYELDWENSHDHCVKGSELLRETSSYEKYSDTILYHHTHCEELPKHLDKKIKERANIIYMTDRIDVLTAVGKNIDEVIEVLEEFRDKFFYGYLIDTFLVVLKKYDPISVIKNQSRVELFFDGWISETPEVEVSFEKIREIAVMFSRIVDAKSPFTREHSFGVASLSKHIASLLHLDEDSCQKVEIAGFLHDLGKLRVPDEILHKRGPLDNKERDIMSNHSGDGAKILYDIKGFEEIAEFTALHHETLDSKGYPLHRGAKEIPYLARIIAIADIFQALVQDRPYREGLTPEVSIDILKDMASKGKLDIAILSVVEKNLNSCYKSALPEKIIDTTCLAFRPEML
jgi:putative nucleotidyltransferase with HDIG domain